MKIEVEPELVGTLIVAIALVLITQRGCDYKEVSERIQAVTEQEVKK